MEYIIGFIVLVAAEGAFLVLSRRRHVGAAVTARSSHTCVTPTAGGIAFILAAAACVVFNRALMSTAAWVTAGAALLLGAVSFADDMRPLPWLPRLLAQVAAVTAAYWFICPGEPAWVMPVAAFGALAFINSLNFLDGIRCMLGFYALVAVATLWYVLGSAACAGMPSQPLLTQLCLWMMLGIGAFLAFNLSDSIFCGDTGSVFAGFIISVLLTAVILYTGDITYLTLVIVCLCDTALTTVLRLFSGKNIFKPHRTFLYQLLTTRFRWTHMRTATVYAALQLVINLIFLRTPLSVRLPLLITIAILLSLIHLAVRRRAEAIKGL